MSNAKEYSMRSPSPMVGRRPNNRMQLAVASVLRNVR